MGAEIAAEAVAVPAVQTPAGEAAQNPRKRLRRAAVVATIVAAAKAREIAPRLQGDRTVTPVREAHLTPPADPVSLEAVK